MSEQITMDLNGYTRQVTVNDGMCEMIYEAFAHSYNRPETVADPSVEGETMENPQSKQSFTTERIRIFIEQVVSGHQKRIARGQASGIADAQVDEMLSSVVVAPE